MREACESEACGKQGFTFVQMGFMTGESQMGFAKGGADGDGRFLTVTTDSLRLQQRGYGYNRG